MSHTSENSHDEAGRLRLSSRLWDDLPESKLELLDGRLIAGNSLAGSRYLFWAILTTLGPSAALPPEALVGVKIVCTYYGFVSYYADAR